MTTSTLPDMLAAAHAYADRFGLAVVPIHSPAPDQPSGCDCRNDDCASPAKHPRTLHGLQDASLDAQEIERWWSGWPAANIAARTGGDARYVVVDVDPKHGGDESLRDLDARHGGLPATPAVSTGGGGFHYWFRAPDGATIRNSAGKLGPGLDIRAEGGYVLVPPSLHVSGEPYRWLTDSHIRDIAVAELPQWLVDLLQEPEHPAPAATVDGSISTGSRNNTLASLAGTMRHRGMSEPAMVAALLKENEEKCDPPLGEAEVTAIAHSVARYEPAPESPLRKNEESRRKSPATPLSSSNFVLSQGQEAAEAARSIVVPPFPTSALPPVVRRYVEEGSAALGVPPDFIAVPLVANAGGMIGRTARLQLKQGYEQYPALWSVVVGPPGAAKTPALDLARYPLDVEQERAQLQQELDLARLEADLARQKDGTAPQNPMPERPEVEHFYSTDSTTEAIAKLLMSSPGFTLQRDEITGWVNDFGAYKGGRGGDRQKALSMWSFVPLKVDRKTQDSIYIPKPVVSVAGGCQPDMLAALAQESGRRDGFLERFLWSWYESHPQPWTTDVVSGDARQDLLALFQSLRGSAREVPPVTLSEGAADLFKDWFNDNQAITFTSTGIMQGVHAKMHNQLARITLVLQGWTVGGNPSGSEVTADVMGGGIEIAEYHRGHAQKVFSCISTAAPIADQRLDGRVFRLIEDAAPESVPRTDLHRGLGGGVLADDLTAALQRLEQRGLIEQVPSESRGGRPAERWRLRKNEESPVGDEPLGASEVRV
jgi:hypothetical protein